MAKVRAAVVQVATDDFVGTGVVLPDGNVLSAYHVVEGYEGVTLTLEGGRELEAQVKAVDWPADLALLHVEADSRLPSLEWSEEEPDLGRRVLVLGFSAVVGESSEPNVTTGLVSRRFTLDSIRYMQTDAALNPGDSGGPVIDLCGRVLGISVAKELEAEGTGYAVSAGYAQASIARMLRSPVKYAPGYVGDPLGNGDCVQFVEDNVEAASCSGAHDAVVVAVLRVPGGTTYPGESEVTSFADRECPRRAESYTYPTRETWELGDRRIHCFDEDR